MAVWDGANTAKTKAGGSPVPPTSNQQGAGQHSEQAASTQGSVIICSSRPQEALNAPIAIRPLGLSTYLLRQEHCMSRCFLFLWLFEPRLVSKHPSLIHWEQCFPCLKQIEGLQSQIALIIYSGLEIPEVISEKMYFKMFGSKMTR